MSQKQYDFRETNNDLSPGEASTHTISVDFEDWFQVMFALTKFDAKYDTSMALLWTKVAPAPDSGDPQQNYTKKELDALTSMLKIATSVIE